jgi:hypothetical protein
MGGGAFSASTHSRTNNTTRSDRTHPSNVYGDHGLTIVRGQ